MPSHHRGSATTPCPAARVQGLDLQRTPVPHVGLTLQQQVAMDADVDFILGSL